MERNSNRRLFYFTSLFVGILAANMAPAAELLVQAKVEPYVNVTTVNPEADIGSVAGGTASGTFMFSVESNSTRVSVQALVTNLYKDVRPGSAEIPVDTAAGVDLAPVAAIPVNGSDLNAAFRSTDTLNKPSGIFEGHKTEQVDLESTQGDFFNQDIDVTVNWLDDGKIRPAGNYGGYVVLYVTVLQ